MQHIKSKINFKQFNPDNELVYDLKLAADSGKSDDLARFVRTYYSQDWSKWTLNQFGDSWSSYQGLINAAIKSDNLMGLETLWQGIYFHDRANPDYTTDVYTAAEFGNLKMLQHVLYGYMNYNTLDEVEDLEYAKLKELAAKNSHQDVLEFVESIACCVTSDNKIAAVDKRSLKEEENENEEVFALGKKFYECVENFVAITV